MRGVGGEIRLRYTGVSIGEDLGIRNKHCR